MAASDISGLTAFSGAPATGDLIPATDISDTTQDANGTTKKMTVEQLINAVEARVNTFAVAQNFHAASSSTQALVVRAAASATVRAFEIEDSAGAAGFDVLVGSSSGVIQRMIAQDNGANAGNQILIGNNTNGSTPAAGFINMTDKGGSGYRVWPDDTGVLRIHTADPTNANDTAGTVVGAQTSVAAAKNLMGDGVDPARALTTILETAIHRFKYKNDAYNGSEFHGIVADDSPEFAMDDGRVFNPINAFGYTVQAFKAMAAKIEELETKLAELTK